jgi:hypothetical protein
LPSARRNQNVDALRMTSPITRRTALRSLASAAALAALPRAIANPSTVPMPPATTPPEPSPGFRHSVCKWCYPKISLEDLAKAAKGLGLASIELLNPDEFATLKKYDLHCAMVSNPTGKTAQGATVGGITRAFNRTEHHDTLVELYTRRIGDTAAAGFENLICFSGNREKWMTSRDSKLRRRSEAHHRTRGEAQGDALHGAAQFEVEPQGLHVRPHLLGRRAGEAGWIGTLSPARRHLPHADYGG